MQKTEQQHKEVLFIYNAKSSPLNQAIDFFHKMTSSASYPCNLSKLTNDGLNMNAQWKEFIDSLRVKPRFLYKDEFERKHPNYKTEYPAVLLTADETFEPFITAEEISGYTKLDELIEAVSGKINQGGE